MWQWSLTWGDIRDDLVVGACPMTAEDIDRIRAGAGASALLSVQTDLCRAHFGIDYAAHVRHGRAIGLAMANAPMRDFDPPDQRRRLPDAVRCLGALLAEGRRVYVHCTAGINRSPLTVLAYLTFVEGLGTDDAMARILAARPEAQPYWEAYHGCRADLLDRHRDAIRVEAYRISQRPDTGGPPDDWGRAERLVLSRALSTAPTHDACRIVR